MLPIPSNNNNNQSSPIHINNMINKQTNNGECDGVNERVNSAAIRVVSWGEKERERKREREKERVKERERERKREREKKRERERKRERMRKE